MEKPTLGALMTQHTLTVIAVAKAARVDERAVIRALNNTALYAPTALAVLQGVNQLAGTSYGLADVNPESYYGGLVPGSMFEPGPAKRWWQQ